MSLKRIKPPRRSNVEIADEQRVREQFQDRPTVEALVKMGEIDPDRIMTGPAEELLLKTLGALQRERQSRELSLTEIAQRSGIDLASLNRLETGTNPNPTLELLSRYAAAVGLQLELSLVEIEDNVSAPSSSHGSG